MHKRRVCAFFFRWMMISEFEIFGKVFSLYQLSAIIGIFVAGIWACRAAVHKRLDDNDMIVVLLICGAGALLGGHLLYGITRLDAFSAFRSVGSIQDLLLILYSLFGGSVFYGGLLGGGAACYLYFRKKRLPADTYTDILSCAVPLFHFFGRIGCFSSGCCYGIPCKIGVLYQHAAVETANGARRFPVQLLEAGLNLILFFILSRLLKKGKYGGKLLFFYLFSYSCARFFIEFLRADEYRGFLFGLSTSQWISLFLLAGAVSCYQQKYILPAQNP